MVGKAKSEREVARRTRSSLFLLTGRDARDARRVSRGEKGGGRLPRDRVDGGGGGGTLARAGIGNVFSLSTKGVEREGVVAGRLAEWKDSQSGIVGVAEEGRWRGREGVAASSVSPQSSGWLVSSADDRARAPSWRRDRSLSLSVRSAAAAFARPHPR